MGAWSCCGPVGFVRQYSTREERIERLEAYAAALERELTAVRERAGELRAR